MNTHHQSETWIEELRAQVGQHAQRPQPPSPLADLIGRAAEQAALLHHFHGLDHRLVTLVGPGGMGKTSLALHTGALIAASNGPIFADGVGVVMLAAVNHAGDVPLAIAEALGYSFQGSRPVADQLVEALHDRAMLLVLDNVEHLLSPENGTTLVKLISGLLTGAPKVRLLVTSRERLRLRDEWVLELGGLAIPAADGGPKTEQAEAVQLFVERAQRSASSFTLSAKHRPAVARICRQLEGMPLAIELAATWVRAMTPDEIAAELGRALDLLSHAARDQPARHRSVRATLDHSWNLLDADERSTLARLSVFAGGCDREAAQTVTGATLSTIAALLDKSLVRAEAVDGITRYRLHPLVQQYAAERLADDPGDQQVTTERHINYVATLVERTIDLRTGASIVQGRAVLNHNIDNLRAAWAQALAIPNLAALSTLMRAFWMIYDDHSWLHDAVKLFGDAADTLAGLDGAATLRGYLLGSQAYFLTRIARYSQAHTIVEQALAILHATGATEGLATVVLYHGVSLCHSGHLDQAGEQFAKAAELGRAAGDLFVELWAELWLAVIATFRGDYATAKGYIAAFLGAFRQVGYKRGEGSGCAAYGEVARCNGQLDEAAIYLREGLRIGSVANDALTICACLCQLGALALERDELDEARYLLQESAALMREMGDPWLVGRALTFLARVEIRRGDVESARLACAELARIALDGEAMLLGDAVLSFALLLNSAGEYAESWAMLHRFHSVPAKAELKPVAGLLRAGLEGVLAPAQQVAAVEAARNRELEPWLKELIRRTFVFQPPTSTAAPRIVQTATPYIAETGETLSPREVDVLRLIASGADNATIAQQLVVSIHTVKTHVAHILAKLNVASRTAAALRARELGLM